MGGLFDGIVLHQILQVHNMMSARIPATDLVGVKANMTYDGYFHAAVYVVVLAGIVLLFRAGRRDDVVWSGRVLLGAGLMGFGAFNLVEGLVDHHILGLHHVLEYADPSTRSLADILFLLSGVVLVLIGLAVTRSRPKP